MKLILLNLVAASVLYSVTPGKWSPMDQFVIGNSTGGPVEEIVKDENGKVIYRAVYTYNSIGKLVTEMYYDNSVYDGKTVFTYKNSHVVKEVLFSKTGQVMEWKKYSYAGKNLKTIELYSSTDDKLLTCKVGENRNGFIQSAETVWAGKIDKERFVTAKEVNSDNLVQSIFDGDDKKVGKIVYQMDKQGRILKRENVQQGIERMNVLEYDREGRLQKSTFHVKRGKALVLVKSHYFTYGTTAKGMEMVK